METFEPGRLPFTLQSPLLWSKEKVYICHCGNLLVLQARLQWIWKWGTKRVTEGLGGARQDIQGKRYLSASCGSAVEDDLLESVASQAQLVTIT